jgi:hypothetical protein
VLRAPKEFENHIQRKSNSSQSQRVMQRPFANPPERRSTREVHVLIFTDSHWKTKHRYWLHSDQKHSVNHTIWLKPGRRAWCWSQCPARIPGSTARPPNNAHTAGIAVQDSPPVTLEIKPCDLLFVTEREREREKQHGRMLTWITAGISPAAKQAYSLCWCSVPSLCPKVCVRILRPYVTLRKVW